MNYISNNVEEATDAGVNNQWDDGRNGNYWGDYIENYPEASDIGGIWDTAYEIPGGTGALDKFPLVKNTNLDDIIPPNPEIPGFSLWFIFGFSLIGIFILIILNNPRLPCSFANILFVGIQSIIITFSSF